MYIQNETITGDGALTEFALANNFKAGSILITYNGKLFYEFKEKSGGSDDDTLVFDFAPEATDSILVSYYTRNEPNVLNATRYATVRQIKALSRVSALVSATDDVVEKLIRETEKYIDALCVGWERYYVVAGSTNQKGQIHIFPRMADDVEYSESNSTGYPPIPSQITQACLYGVENLFLMGDPSEADLGEETIESEKLGDYSYKKTSKSTASDAVMMARNMLGNRSVALLRGFTKNTGQMTVGSNRVDRPESFLNSRKRFQRKQ